MIDKENIKKAIEMGVCFIKEWGEKIRCFDMRMGYGEFIDLTLEEYDIYLKVSKPTREEMLKKLDEVIKGRM